MPFAALVSPAAGRAGAPRAALAGPLRGRAVSNGPVTSRAAARTASRALIERRAPAPLAPGRAAPAGRRRRSAPPPGAFFSRLARIFRSYANAFVTSVEDPEKVLEQAVEDMTKDLARLRAAAAEVTASQRRLAAKRDGASEEAEGWHRRAELALRAGDEGLAREALQRRKSSKERSDALTAQLDAQSRAQDTVVGHVRVLESRLAEARAKKDTLKARAQSARSSKAVQDMITGLDAGTALAAFERMEDRVLAMEAAAEANAALGPAGDALEGRFRELEGDSINDELLALKRGIEAPRARAAIPSEASSARAPLARDPDGIIELDLQELRRRGGGR